MAVSHNLYWSPGKLSLWQYLVAVAHGAYPALFPTVVSDDRKFPLYLCSCIQADLLMSEIYPGLIADKAKDKEDN